MIFIHSAASAALALQDITTTKRAKKNTDSKMRVLMKKLLSCVKLNFAHKVQL